MACGEADDLPQVRRWFAEELRHVAHVQSAAVVDAFAAVPREGFLGPGPWRVLSLMRGLDYWTTDDADPRRLYHDILVAIDEGRRLNNGQPNSGRTFLINSTWSAALTLSMLARASGITRDSRRDCRRDGRGHGP